MAVAAGVLVDHVLKRARDPQATGITKEQTRRLLTECQRLVNAAHAREISVVRVTAQPRRSIYAVSEIAPGAVYIVGVHAGGVSLKPVTWRSLSQVDRRWSRAIGHPRSWATLGRGLVAIYPAPHRPIELDLLTIPLTSAFASDEITTEIPDEHVPLLLDMVEGMILLRSRNFAPAATAIGRALSRMGVEQGQQSNLLEDTGAQG